MLYYLFVLNRIDIRSACIAIIFAIGATITIIFYNKAVIAYGMESYVSLAIASVKALKSLKVLLAIAVFSALNYVCLTREDKVSSFLFKYRL